MAMNVGPSEDGGEDEVISTINTTPLVDVMLVLLIIFLITIPVVTHTVPLVLPKETNQPTQTKPENINISVDQEGNIYWNTALVPDSNALFERLKVVAVMEPQPEVHIRGDQEARYEFVGKVVATCSGPASPKSASSPNRHPEDKRHTAMAIDYKRNGSADPDVVVEINTTPLIDVMLVLLIMLIITIPIQTHAVKLDMPAGNRRRRQSSCPRW